MTDTPDRAAGRQRVAAYLAALAIRREYTGGWRDHLIATEQLPGDDERPLIAGDLMQVTADLEQAEAALADTHQQLAAAITERDEARAMAAGLFDDNAILAAKLGRIARAAAPVPQDGPVETRDLCGAKIVGELRCSLPAGHPGAFHSTSDRKRKR